jgi:hypothetical protein
MIGIPISKEVYNGLLADCKPFPIWPLVLPLDLTLTLPLRFFCIPLTYHIETRNIPYSKCHIWRWRVISSSPKSQAGGLIGSVSRSRLPNPQSEDMPFCGDRGPYNVVTT